MSPQLFTPLRRLTGRVNRSARYGHRSFPTREDYADTFRPGDLGAEPWIDPIFSAAVMRDWHTRGQTGCLFARRLANVADDAHWASVVFTSLPDETLTEEMHQKLAPALQLGMSSAECEIVSLLFPLVESVAGLKVVCRALMQSSPITMSELPSPPGISIIALRLDISGDGKLSWIMAFGPFEHWPPTRRGPLLEFAIRVKPKPPNLFHKLNQDPSAAHLADSDPHLSEAGMETVFERTEKATRDVLGGNPDPRSAAKATFSFPTPEWADGDG